MESGWSAERIAWVQELAAREGFVRAGVAAAPALDEAQGQTVARRLEDFLDQGRAGEMRYLERRDAQGTLLRASARVAMPWARSVIVCALNYNAAGPTSIEAATAGQGWIARYAWLGDEEDGALDYHDDLLRRLRVVEQAVRERMGCETRAYVDTGPLLERDFAARAGVGWIGKNTCVIDQSEGSWLLLGVIVTSLEVPAETASAFAPDRCGSCTRCVDACPTDALLATKDPLAAREMDASRCISYLTIELKGDIPPDLREPMGRQVFGCDICQEVCPWNRRAPKMQTTGLGAREMLINPELAWLAEMDDAAFRSVFKGSPLERTKRTRVQRNVAIAMGNSGNAGFRRQLAVWEQGSDPLLAESARWALRRLEENAPEAEEAATEDVPGRLA